LAKLGRERAGLRYVIEGDLARLCDLIKDPEGGEFPGNFGIVDQGRFALGYYHQRAADFKRRRTKSAPENASTDAEPEQLQED